MTRQEFMTTIFQLEHVYFDWKINDKERAIELWYSIFKEIDYNLFQLAVKEYILTSPYKPTIASLMEKVTEYAVTPDKSPSIAWETVKKGLFAKGYRSLQEFEDNEKLLPTHPIMKALKVVGIKRIKTSQERDLPFLYKEFEKVYMNSLNKTARDLALKGKLSLTENNNLQLEGR